ncbi:MAG: FHA domain-containing protein [Lachnospiraceae bacterium]|nr:FHA domain-containing protein [Lachnospiraceae bacterium]
MREVHYKRDLNSNYMILTDGKTDDNGFEERMITENRIQGLLPCVTQRREESTEYYYEITGKQSMTLLYERRKLTYDQLLELLRGLGKILENAEEYLLGADHFILEPEYIYLHTKSEKPCLCYYPAQEKNIRESFLILAEYLLGKLDRSDTAGIEFGYDLYQRAMEPNFSLKEILQRYQETEERKEPEPIMPPPVEDRPSVQAQTLEKTGSWKNFFRKKSKKPRMEDYVAEADRMGSGSVLFLREQGAAKETMCLTEIRREGLTLKNMDGEYPDLHITESPYLIGKRSDNVDGCIPAPTISRIHARITKQNLQYFLEDLNSTNGTWADQVQLNPYELCPLLDGMQIRFAGASYVVEV